MQRPHSAATSRIRRFDRAYPRPRCRRRALVAAAFLADAERSADGRAAAALPPSRPPFRAGALLTGLPTPEPLFLPPPVILFTVAQARRSASCSESPRFS